jgi:hypothetical protein
MSRSAASRAPSRASRPQRCRRSPPPAPHPPPHNHAVRAAPASPAGAARRCCAAARWCRDNQDAARQWLAECCIDREAARLREPHEGNYHRARGRALEHLGGGFSERKRTGPVVVQSATGRRARTTLPAVGRLSISSVPLTVAMRGGEVFTLVERRVGEEGRPAPPASDRRDAALRQINGLAPTLEVHPSLGVRQPVGDREVRPSQHGGEAGVHISFALREQGHEGAELRRRDPVGDPALGPSPGGRSSQIRHQREVTARASPRPRNSSDRGPPRKPTGLTAAESLTVDRVAGPVCDGRRRAARRSG